MACKSDTIKDVLKTRTYNCLFAKYGNITVGDLCEIFKKDSKEFFKIPNFGDASLRDIKSVIDSANSDQHQEQNKLDPSVLMTSKFSLYEDILSLKEQNAILQTQLKSNAERTSAYMTMCKEYENDNNTLRKQLGEALSELRTVLSKDD